VQYIPTIYGFKIFGQKGSRFELLFDNLGQAKNQKDIDGLLKKKNTMGGVNPVVTTTGPQGDTNMAKVPRL
jgi:hypothetical protein